MIECFAPYLLVKVCYFMFFVFSSFLLQPEAKKAKNMAKRRKIRKNLFPNAGWQVNASLTHKKAGKNMFNDCFRVIFTNFNIFKDFYMLVDHLLCIFLVLPIFSILVVKDAKTPSKVILTSVRHAEHLFAGQKPNINASKKISS